MPTGQPTGGSHLHRSAQIVFVEPEIAANLGAGIRLGACLGAPVHVVEPCGFPFSPRAWARQAMDYADLVTLTRHDSYARFCDARGPGRRIALSARAETALWDFAFQPGDALLLGSESAGLPAEVLAGADAALRIPIAPRARSLNVVTAAAIALGEAVRQLRG